MKEPKDEISLILPFKAEFVSIARLAVSGIANRMGFDIETIEDIKISVAEVCNKIVGTGSLLFPDYKISFRISETCLEISFYSQDEALKSIFNNEEDELGVCIINAFMDSVEFVPGNSCILSMTKAFEGTIVNG